MEVPLTPKSDYVSVQDDPLDSSFNRPDLPSNLPMLDSSHYALERDSVATSSVADNRSTDLSDLAMGTRRRRTPFPILPTRAQRLLRWWIALRWRLSRSLFSVPLPFFTVEFGLKLGDLVVILPVMAYLLASTASQAKDRDVKGSGSAPTITMLLVFLFAIRNNSVLLVATGVPFERVLFYHKLFAFATIPLTALHGLTYLLDRADSGGPDFHHDQMVTGMVAFMAMVAMYILSLNYIRRHFFELFVRLHWILFIVVIVFTVKHGAPLILVGIVPWAIDMLFRLFYRTRIYSHGSLFKPKHDPYSTVSHRKRHMGIIAHEQLSVCAMPGNITRIQFPRVRQDTGDHFDYEAGQYAFLCIPKLSLLEWHPFTISSAPHEAMVTFHIKGLGDWTNKLLRLAGQVSEADPAMPLFDILVDGPYGNVAIDIDSVTTYAHFVLFSGGIGVTPMRSITNWLHYECHYHSREGAPRVRFVWSVRDRETIESVLRQDPEDEDNCHEMDEVAPYLPHILFHPRTMNEPSGDFFSEIYLTRGHPDLEARGDQQFAKCIRYGIRPDVTQILREMGHDALKSRKKRVAVLVCGPPAMVSDVTKTSMGLSREMKLHFDVHSELFDF